MGVYYGMNGLWVPIGGQGGTAPVDPNLLAENIKSGVTISGVTGTFTNDGTATASDILTGKISYVNGIKVTGTMKNLSGGWSVQNLMPAYDASLSSIKLQHSNSVQGYFPANTSISYYSSISNFGDATAADVASGKTFTSSAGLKVTGTASMKLGDTVTVVSLDITTSNWGNQQLSSDRKTLVWTLPDVKINNYYLSAYLNGKVSGISHISFGNLNSVSDDGSSIAVCSIGFDREGNSVGFTSTLNNRLQRTGASCTAVLDKTNNKIIITAVSSGSLLWDANAYYDILTLGLYVDP